MANYRQPAASNDFFLPLDNSATFIASTTSRESPYIFRISCELDEPIYLPDLETVLKTVSERFPLVKTRLLPGMFWYYLDPIPRSPHVRADTVDPCNPPRHGRWRRSLTRVYVHANRISCEFHHILTDGTGALEFMRTLVAAYLTKRGVVCDDWEGVLRPESPIRPGELEDGYAALFRSEVPFPDPLPRAYQLTGKRFRGSEYRVTIGSFFMPEVLAAARERKVTVTVFLVSIYIAALQELAEAPGHGKFLPLCVQIPVNLRKFYPSATLRNFFLFVPVTVDRRLGHYSFDDILMRVHYSMKLGLDVRELNRQIKRNVRGERYLYSRVVPLFLKNEFLRNIGKKSADAAFSGNLSNLQSVHLPKAFAEHVRRFDILPPRRDSTGACIGVASFGDLLSITIGSRVSDSDLERGFFRRCAELGLRVTIAANR